MTPEKVCIRCGGTFPETKDHFRPKGEGRFDTKCRDCLRLDKRAEKNRAKERTAKSVEDAAISTFLQKASQGGENVPHSAELLERMMEYFGGSSGFAALVVKQYFDSPPGSGTRTKLLETVVRLTAKNTELGGAKKPMEQWTDEELEEELDARLRRVAMQFQGRIINATPETAHDFSASFGGPAGLIPAIATEGVAGRGRESEDRGSEDVSADSDSSGDALLQGE